METRIAFSAQNSQHRRQQMKFRRSAKGHLPRSTIRRNEQEVLLITGGSSALNGVSNQRFPHHLEFF